MASAPGRTLHQCTEKEGMEAVSKGPGGTSSVAAHTHTHTQILSVPGQHGQLGACVEE